MAGRVASKHIKRGAVVTQRGAAHVAAFIQSLQEHLQVQLFFAAGTSIQPVPYTHLTLPTKRESDIPAVGVLYQKRRYNKSKNM